MSDFNFELKPAIREAVPPLVALWGPSGAGKTLSALYLARGIVGPQGKIAVVDTENGRAKFYDKEAGGWLHLDLQPKFTPEKYTAAFEFCESQRTDCIIVDSGSHVWEGEGGVLDSVDTYNAERDRGATGLAAWKAPKMAHKRMMNSLTRSALPVIFCLRAKEGVKQIGKGKDMKIVQTGWQPIAEKNFIYEMTLALHMVGDGKYDLETSKIPKALKLVFPEGGIVHQGMGEKVSAWTGSGAETDDETMRLERAGQDAAMNGVKAYTEWLAELKPEQKEKVKIYHKEWSSEAKAADKAYSEGANDPFQAASPDDTALPPNKARYLRGLYT